MRKYLWILVSIFWATIAVAQDTTPTTVVTPENVKIVIDSIVAVLTALGGIPGWGQWALLAAVILGALSPLIGRVLPLIISGDKTAWWHKLVPAITSMETINPVKGKDAVSVQKLKAAIKSLGQKVFTTKDDDIKGQK